MTATITIKKAKFEQERRIAVFFPKEEALIARIRKVPTSKWSPTHRCWHFPYNSEIWGVFKSYFKDFTLNILDNEEPIRIPYREMIPEPTMPLKEEYKQKALEEPLKPKAAASPAEPFDFKAHVIQLKKEYPDKVIVTTADFWRGKLRIDFPFNPEWVKSIKTIEGKYWHNDLKCWSVPHSPLIMDVLKRHFGENLYIDLKPHFLHADSEIKNPKYIIETPPQYAAEITKLEEQLILRRYSHHTRKTYKNHFTQFIYYYNNIPPADITKEQIIQYMLYRIKTHRISESFQNTLINAIKCYYEQVLGRDRTIYDLQRPKRPFQLPNVLTQEEVIKLFKAVDNIKHKCILLAIYSSGLRLSEVINLRLADINKHNLSIKVKSGKGKKDRFTMLSPILLEHLEVYCTHYNPTYWLFEGQTGGQYSARSVQNILKDAVKKSGVNPHATVHTLRHSFATHLVLDGENLLLVKELLGHESPETTQIYVHLSAEQIRKVQSPLDKLKL